MLLWWTKRSLLPSSGVMKPKPFSALNHLTVPCAMLFLLACDRAERRDSSLRVRRRVRHFRTQDPRGPKLVRLPWDRYDTNSRTVTRNQYSMTCTEHRIRPESCTHCTRSAERTFPTGNAEE